MYDNTFRFLAIFNNFWNPLSFFIESLNLNENTIIFPFNTFTIDSFTMVKTAGVKIVDILKDLALSEVQKTPSSFPGCCYNINWKVCKLYNSITFIIYDASSLSISCYIGEMEGKYLLIFHCLFWLVNLTRGLYVFNLNSLLLSEYQILFDCHKVVIKDLGITTY